VSKKFARIAELCFIGASLFAHDKEWRKEVKTSSNTRKLSVDSEGKILEVISVSQRRD
jgi:hypothetical protein